ncbi:hypothetical protein BH10ACT7_BH10ACT7_30810 [soil metagenome]
MGIPKYSPIVAAVILLAGCAPITDAADYEQATGELRSLVDALAATVPGEWEITATGARACNLPGGGTGATLLLLGLGPGVERGTERETADRMVTILTDSGYDITLSDRSLADGPLVLEGRSPGAGPDPEGFMVFGVSERATTIQGQARCAAGDANQINSETDD